MKSSLDLVISGVIGSKNVPWLDFPASCYNMGHNGHGINLYGVIMIIMVN